MTVIARPTSLGRFSKRGRICLRPSLARSPWALAAAFSADNEFT